MTEIIFTWRTQKVKNGFRFNVMSIKPQNFANKSGQFAETKIIKTGVLSSRAKAKGMAIRFVRFFRAKNR